MQEIWKDIKDYEGLYQVSNLGNIKNTLKNRIIKNTLEVRGYLTNILFKNNKSKIYKNHRLVAQAFIDNPENKPQVNHIDGNKLNNCINNLEWVTNSENQLHKTKILGIKTGFQINHPAKGKFGKYNNKAKKVNQYDLDGNFIKTWGSMIDVEKELLICRKGISGCCRGVLKTSGGFIWKFYS